MAEVVRNLFRGGAKVAETPAAAADSDFADFANVPDPSPIPFTPAAAAGGASLGANAAPTPVPYTKWYNVHERHSLSEFKLEGYVLISIAVVMALHLLGARANRGKARRWLKAHSKTLTSEFAHVGFDRVPDAAVAGTEGDELVAALERANEAKGNALLKESSLFEFATYATGRQNVAFMDVKLTLVKRFNPMVSLPEKLFSFFIDAVPAPADVAEATIYPFDGKESMVVPSTPGTFELRTKDVKSGYDNFVWALVNKERMKELRDDRYDVSITFTKDHPKLPAWLTVMSESAEITDVLLTPELIKAAEDAGDVLDYIIISDQPTEKPTKVEEANPRKRLFLKYRLPSDNNYVSLLPLFSYFVRLPDHLVQAAHFRPEVVRKVKAVRDETIKQIQKAGEDEKAEERALERERLKKAKRDAELNALDAKAQKKYLEKEREKQQRKSQKKMTTRA